MRRLPFARSLASSLVLAAPLLAEPAQFWVTRFDDGVDTLPGDGQCLVAGGGCTLRAGVMESNALAAGAFVIMPGGTYRLTLTAGPDDASFGDLDIQATMLVTGFGMRETVVVAETGDRVLEIHGGDGYVYDLTLRGGVAALGGGGGIRVGAAGNLFCQRCLLRDNRSNVDGGGVEVLAGGQATIDTSIVASNQAAGCGGGVAVRGEAAVLQSRVARNLSTARGGGLCARAGGLVEVLSSTVDGNVAAGNGGGLELDGGSHAIYDTTVSGNRAARGAGLHLAGTAQVASGSGQLTVAENAAAIEAGGAWAEAGTTLELANSILADNSAPASPDCLGALSSSHGHNLVEQAAGCSLTGTTTGNLTAVDPQLLPLANYGFLTPTHELANESSPAVDAGADGFSASDQRTYDRPAGPQADIGATEFHGIVPVTLEQFPFLLEMNGQTGLRPTVRNLVSRFRADVNGTLVSFTGPPGPGYSIPDSVADYGLVLGGSTSKCSSATGNCYAVRNELPLGQNRPAAHVDMVAEETTESSSHHWRVHVGGSFADTLLLPEYPVVEGVFHHGVTQGCGPNAFCPRDALSRRQLALMLERAFWGEFPLPFTADGDFSDVPPSDPYAPWIERFAADGMALGCASDPDGPGPLGARFCPDAPVRRDQFAGAVLRMRDGAASVQPPCIGAPFLDVSPSDPACPWIAAATRQGVVAPCVADPDGSGPLLGRFCPAGAMTRLGAARSLAEAFTLEPWSLGL